MTRLTSPLRRYLVLLVAAVMAVAGLASVPAPPAFAVSAAQVSTTRAAQPSAFTTANAPLVTMGPPANSICLTNADSFCLGIDPGTAAVIVASIEAAVRILEIFKGKDNNGDNEDEIEDESNGLCLQDTGLQNGVAAHWGACGANGTVWILVPHTDGAYIYSRYSVDHFDSKVLTANPLRDGAAFYVDTAANPGSADWQTFTHF
jgi:hypothetical protein